MGGNAIYLEIKGNEIYKQNGLQKIFLLHFKMMIDEVATIIFGYYDEIITKQKNERK